MILERERRGRRGGWIYNRCIKCGAAPTRLVGSLKWFNWLDRARWTSASLNPWLDSRAPRYSSTSSCYIDDRVHPYRAQYRAALRVIEPRDPAKAPAAAAVSASRRFSHSLSLFFYNTRFSSWCSISFLYIIHCTSVTSIASSTTVTAVLIFNYTLHRLYTCKTTAFSWPVSIYQLIEIKTPKEKSRNGKQSSWSFVNFVNKNVIITER